MHKNLYHNDIIIRKYWETNDTKLLHNLQLYNYNINYITNLLSISDKIVIHDNDSGLLGYALSKLGYSATYSRISKTPLHCVLITNQSLPPQSPPQSPTQSPINIHFISTHSDYKLISPTQKNIIFTTDLYYSLLRSSNIQAFLIKH